MNRFLFLLFFFTTSFMSAQVVAGSNNSTSNSVAPNEFFILDIEPNNFSIDLSALSPSEAGQEYFFSSNSEKWLNYTSSVPFGDVRTISVSVTGSLSGLSLSLTVSPCTSCFGVFGVPVGTVVLGSTPQNVINGIGGSYTGNGPNLGHNLIYSLSITNYAQILASNNNLTIIYTITDL